MSFYRIKTIKKNGKTYSYLVRQTNVRKGKKVYSIMEHICGFAIAAASPGRPGGFSGHRPTDKRHIKHQEESDRELFDKNRGAFNVKQRQDYERQQKVREAAKASRESKLSRSERQERAEAKDAAERKVEETMEAVREFNEARAQILVWQMPSLYRRNAFRQTALKQKRGEFMMMFFYLPLVVLDGLLAAYEANTRLCRVPMPTPKTGEPTVIMME